MALTIPACTRPVPTSILLTLYRAIYAARLIDRREAELVRSGDAFFHLSSEGHEAIAALAPHLAESDWLACYYRDKALLIYRGVPLQAIFSTQLSRADAPGAGRQMPDILGDPSRNVLSMPVPVGNHALHAVGVAAALAQSQPRLPRVTVCSLGDGTSQQGEVLEAIAEAVRRELPVLFVVEDNGLSISTKTIGKTFLSRPDGPASEFYGLPITKIDGRDVASAYWAFGDAVTQVRSTSQPALVWFRVERLSSHSNADDHSVYRNASELSAARAWDPLPLLESLLLHTGMPGIEISALARSVELEVSVAERKATVAADPDAGTCAKAALPQGLVDREKEYRGQPRGAGPRLGMGIAIREVLRHHLTCDRTIVITGQDIEDPKGDVFGITRGLSTAFPGRVLNAALSESTIVGTAIGRALAGQRPIAMIQFADFLPLAFNQLANELATLYWRTCGACSCPVLIMAPCGAYKPGMGPFHAQSFEAIATHVPGIDVFMPGTASDAAGLLHAALASPRPALFLYPKALLNDPAQDTSDDVARQFVPIGVARRVRAGRDLTLVGWGNMVGLCIRVADALLDAGITTDIFDLRSLSPWDQDAVVTSAGTTGRLLVIHEDNLTCGFGAEVVAQVTTRCARHVRAARLARPDVHIPYHFGNQLALLPTFRSALTAAASLLDLDLSWDEAATARKDGHVIVPVIGSGPSDETVLVAKLLVRVGDHVSAGDPIAVVDADKSAIEMVAPESGIVESIAAAEGDEVPVGAMLLTLRNTFSTRRAPVFREAPAAPHLRRSSASAMRAVRQSSSALPVVGVRAIAGVSGSRVVANPELLLQFPGRTEQEVIRRTGIVSRRRIGPGEDALSLAALAARQALSEASVCVDDLDLVICSTGTPLKTTPSMACLLLAKLGQNATRSTAYDMNAACSGYIYALRTAYDFLHANPAGRALVVTTEVLSEKLNVQDFETAFLFGDAATATLLVGDEHIQEPETVLYRPLLGAKAEHGDTLSVPLGGQGAFLTMHGTKVFSLAVRSMISVLNEACCEAGLTVASLDLVVPHQANRRILDAIQSRIGRPVFSNIDMVGNTSSSSIPLALSTALKRSTAAERHIGLCAFGGGFTFGAAVMRVRNGEQEDEKRR